MFKVYEDKEEICRMLLPVLQETTNMSNVKDLKYNKDKEIVTAVVAFSGSLMEIEINVNGDCGAAMIIDIVKALM